MLIGSSPLGFADSFLVYDALSPSDLESVSAGIVGHYPEFQTDDQEVVVVYNQAYITDSFEWSVGSGIRSYLGQIPNECTPSPCTDDDRERVHEYFIHYTETDSEGSYFIIFGYEYEENAIAYPGTSIDSIIGPELCFTSTPDQTNPNFSDVSRCMNPNPIINDEIGIPSYVGMATSKLFSGDCEPCRGALNGDYVSMRYIADSTIVYWDEGFNDPSVTSKCYNSDGFIYDLQLDPIRFQAVFRDELEGNGMDCLTPVLASGPKGTIFSEGVRP